MKGNIDGSMRWLERLRTDEKQQPQNACGRRDVEDGDGGDGEDVNHRGYVQQKTLYLDEDR